MEVVTAHYRRRVFARGSHLVVRDIWAARLWDAVPVTVIEHDDEWLVDHQAVGTVVLGRTCRGREKLDALERRAWVLGRSVVTEPGINFYRRDGWSRVGMAWSADYSDFRGWYVNLQQPLRPSRMGVDTMDLILDVRIAPSGEWTWKDEHDFAEAIDRGILDGSLDTTLRREVDEVLRLRDAELGPFAPHWRSWRPPADPAAPVLPNDVEVE